MNGGFAVSKQRKSISMNTQTPEPYAKPSAPTSSSTTPYVCISRWTMKLRRPYIEAALPHRPLTLTVWSWLVENKWRGCGVGRSNLGNLARAIVPASSSRSRHPCSAGQLLKCVTARSTAQVTKWVDMVLSGSR